MTTRLGLVGLCTSHAQNWVPIIRDLAKEGKVDVTVAAAWDSAETRREKHAHVFCEKFDIPKPIDKLEDMVNEVDCVIVHTANWDQHINQARPFVEANKPVLLDKPIVGNLKDINQLLDWEKQGKMIVGGSSLRYAEEVPAYLNQPVEERGEIHTAFAGCGTDEFNYGIHAYALLWNLMGVGVRSVRYVSESRQRHLHLKWKDGRVAFLTVGKGAWLPFYVTAVTDKTVKHIEADSGKIYRALLEACLPSMCGKGEAPMSIRDLIEPEMAALAALASWRRGGQEIHLTDLHLDEAGYDGHQFGVEYRRALTGYKF